MYSVWWSGLAGVDVDLKKRERIVLNGVNGWTGILTGPAVAPIAVAAIAMCHGYQALLVHPDLEELRRGGPKQSLPPPAAGNVDAEGVIVRLPTRGPMA
jgi:hypothetical protein